MFKKMLLVLPIVLLFLVGCYEDGGQGNSGEPDNPYEVVCDHINYSLKFRVQVPEGPEFQGDPGVCTQYYYRFMITHHDGPYAIIIDDNHKGTRDQKYTLSSTFTTEFIRAMLPITVHIELSIQGDGESVDNPGTVNLLFGVNEKDSMWTWSRVNNDSMSISKDFRLDYHVDFSDDDYPDGIFHITVTDITPVE